MARTSSKRTDPHRPGAIVPAHYEYVFSFSLSSSEGGWPIPSEGINCALDHRRWEKDAEGKDHCINGEHRLDGECCVIGLREKGFRFARNGGPGKCDVCGAHYVHGDVWRHIPTGELIFLGHDCAEKYALLADRSEHELRMGRLRSAAAAQCEKARRAEAYVAFCTEHAGLAEALEVEHYIVADLKRKLREYGELSEKQIALALKIAHEVQNPEAAEVTVPAPTGKRTFRGTIVSVKVQDGAYGQSIKMTVKVTTPEGVWLAWGTLPSALVADHGCKTGAEVEVTATLKAGRDPHFAIMSRPRGTVLRRVCAADCSECEEERLRADLGDQGYTVFVTVRATRLHEVSWRRDGHFDAAARASGEADEMERTGRLLAAREYYSS